MGRDSATNSSKRSQSTSRDLQSTPRSSTPLRYQLNFPDVLSAMQKSLLDIDGTISRIAQKPKSNKFVVNTTRVGKKRTEESVVSLQDGTKLEKDSEGRLVVFQAGKKPKVILNNGGLRNQRDNLSRPGEQFQRSS